MPNFKWLCFTGSFFVMLRAVGADAKMGTNRFTEEQRELLQSNPYVVKVSETSITYTEELKERFYQDYKAGNPPSAILRAMGFDSRVLGKRRLDHFVAQVKRHEERQEDFRDRRTESCGRPRTKALTPEEKISRLEHQVQYLKQENEFLKKVSFLDKKAEWKAKQHQRKNTGSSDK
jgi:transposase